jgi:hypothetical protein
LLEQARQAGDANARALSIELINKDGTEAGGRSGGDSGFVFLAVALGATPQERNAPIPNWRKAIFIRLLVAGHDMRKVPAESRVSRLLASDTTQSTASKVPIPVSSHSEARNGHPAACSKTSGPTSKWDFDL